MSGWRCWSIQSRCRDHHFGIAALDDQPIQPDSGLSATNAMMSVQAGFTAAMCIFDPISMAAAPKLTGFNSRRSSVVVLAIANPPSDHGRGVWAMPICHLPNRDRHWNGGASTASCRVKSRRRLTIRCCRSIGRAMALLRQRRPSELGFVAQPSVKDDSHLSEQRDLRTLPPLPVCIRSVEVEATT